MKRVLMVVLIAGCATTGNKGDLDALKPTLEAFHREMRWKNISQLPDYLMPDRREGFVKASNARNDEKNLFVTDFSLEACDLKPKDQTEAVCYSKVSWYRLPSNSEQTVTVATTLKWVGGQWLIERQSDGPFAEELSLDSKADPK